MAREQGTEDLSKQSADVDLRDVLHHLSWNVAVVAEQRSVGKDGKHRRFEMDVGYRGVVERRS